MLVRECQPGDIVEARGWDVAVSHRYARESEPAIAWLIPFGMNHKEAVEMGRKSVLFYVGPYCFSTPVGKTGIRKMHHFLTETGRSICLEGNEFRHFTPCTT